MAKKIPEKAKPLIKSDNNFPVVGIGASAGGLTAFKRLLGAIPEDSGMAYVLVQHLDPEHESLLPELLQKGVKIPVYQITDDIPVQPNHIYIIPSNKMLLATDGVLKLNPRPKAKKNQLNLPIDLFFKSLAEVHQSHSLGVVLSGTASDGTQGLKAIKDKGGITFAQDEESAEWPDMPRNAVNEGVVDFVLKPENIPAKILEMRSTLGENDTEKENITPQQEDAFRQILSLLRIRKGTDFTYYKQTTIRRRILRRMAITKNKKTETYLNYLRENRKEQDNLYQDLLIPVTSFFREPEIFDNLCTSVLPSIAENKKEDEPVRLWIAGCSTGEEAYSFAMCLQEYFNDNPSLYPRPSIETNVAIKRSPGLKVQIFATDLSEPAIAKARKGLYSKNEVAQVGSKRLKEFFTKFNGEYLITKEIREMCVFAEHDFLVDPPFGNMDLISCRNVLIYLQPYLQKKALTTFHYALNKNGYMLLGKSETSGSMPDHFSTVRKDDRLFKRNDASGSFMLSSSRQSEKVLRNKNYLQIDTEKKRTDFEKNADQLLLNNYTPASVVVNEALDIVLFRGNTDHYLGQQSGKPSHNLQKKAKGGLTFELRNIIHKAKKADSSYKKENIPFQMNGKNAMIAIEAVPLPKMVDPHYLILFHPQSSSIETTETSKGKATKKDEKDFRIQQLEKELSQSREDMRAITEDQEAANEELQSANEELLSGSEELQSLNEELKTSREELQSTNEELTVINQELNSLNEIVSEERNFAEAIIKTIREPLLVLDKDLKVITANSSFYSTFKVKKKETEGKMLYNLGNSQWDIPKLRELLDSILPDKKSFTTFEVTHKFEDIGKRSMLLNAQEVRHKSQDKKMILLAIEDVTERKQAEETNKESLHRYHEMIHSSPSLIAILEGEDFIINIANDAILKQLGKGKGILGQPYLKVVPELEEQGLGKLLRNVYNTGEPFYAHEMPVTLMRNGKKELSYYNFVYQPQKDTSEKTIGVAIIANEVTAQAKLHKKIKEKEERYHQMANLIPEKITNADKEGNVHYFNHSWADFTGLSLKRLQRKGWVDYLHPNEKKTVIKNWKHSVKTGDEFEMEFRLKNKQDNYIWHLSRAIPVTDDKGEINMWIGVSTEIQKLKEEEKRKGDFLKLVSHELKTPVTSIKGYAQMLLSMLQAEGEIKYETLPLTSFLERIDNQLSRLTRLISEMLDLTRIEESQLNLQQKLFTLNGLVDECVQDIEYSSRESQIKVIHKDKFDIYADYDRIGQVLINFITNAIKYSPDNKNIDITVFKTDENQGSVSVIDHGIGIAKKDLKSIFKRFYRVSGKNEETYAGFGIGLYLSKEIIDRHGGQIEVRSDQGKGSEFIFTLPIVNKDQNI